MRQALQAAGESEVQILKLKRADDILHHMNSLLMGHKLWRKRTIKLYSYTINHNLHDINYIHDIIISYAISAS